MEADELSMLYTHMLSSIDFTIPTVAILDFPCARFKPPPLGG
jgi:hypothetical protein